MNEDISVYVQWKMEMLNNEEEELREGSDNKKEMLLGIYLG